MTQVPLRQTSPPPIVYPTTKSGITVDDVRDEHLFGIDLRSPITKAELPLKAIWTTIREQEDWVERYCSIRWRPTRITCEPTQEANAQTFDEIEAAYDYHQDHFDVYRFGFLKLRLAPVMNVTEFAFGFPNRSASLFTVPLSWVRLDGPFGFLRLVPDHGAAMANFSAYMLTQITGGRGVPQAIYVGYEVGQTPQWWSTHHHDLVHAVADLAASEVLLRMAGARASKEGQSLSVSADGMSQSRSGAHDALLKHAQERQTRARKAVDSWRDQQKGPMLGWL